MRFPTCLRIYSYRHIAQEKSRERRSGETFHKSCLFFLQCGKKRSRYNKHPLRAGWTLLPEVWTVLPRDMDICRAANAAKNK